MYDQDDVGTDGSPCCNNCNSTRFVSADTLYMEVRKYYMPAKRVKKIPHAAVSAVTAQTM